MDNEYNYNEIQNEYTTSLELEAKVQKRLEEKARRKRVRRTRAKKVTVVLGAAFAFGIVSAATFLGVTYGLTDALDLEIVNETQVEATVVSTEVTTEITSDVVDITAAVMPSIVSITNLSVQEVQSYFGQSSTYETESAGSGIIIAETESELLILTNNHVIEDNDTITVTFVNEDSIEGVVKGADSEMDLAIVAINLENMSDETLASIKVATLGDSDDLQVGETVIAIGNALGYGQSVTTGVVSALDRELDGFSCTMIQTDAAINPGNSGGALLNANGEVIGINTAKVDLDAVEGMGYAIPISDAMDTINTLISMETLELVDEEDRGYIGISGVSVTEETAAMYNMPVGVYVADITEGGGAEYAGLPVGSIITKIDGYTVETIEELQERLLYYAAGTEVILTIQTVETGGSYVSSEIAITLRELSN